MGLEEDESRGRLLGGGLFPPASVSESESDEGSRVVLGGGEGNWLRPREARAKGWGDRERRRTPEFLWGGDGKRRDEGRIIQGRR